MTVTTKLSIIFWRNYGVIQTSYNEIIIVSTVGDISKRGPIYFLFSNQTIQYNRVSCYLSLKRNRINRNGNENSNMKMIWFWNGIKSSQGTIVLVINSLIRFKRRDPKRPMFILKIIVRIILFWCFQNCTNFAILYQFRFRRCFNPRNKLSNIRINRRYSSLSKLAPRSNAS